MRFQIGNERIIIIDVARSGLEYVVWSAIEEIKDGKWNSSKYKGRWINRRHDVHIVILMNKDPDYE